MNKKGLRLYKATAILLLTVLTMPVFASTIKISPLNYSPISKANGVIEKDRFDFMTANGNPLQEDSANAVFQGPGVFTQVLDDSPPSRTNTTGYMKDIYLEYTKYGTLSKMNYTGEGRPSDPLGYTDEDLPQDGNAWVGVGDEYQDKYHWLPVIEQTAVPIAPGVATAPLEGWAIAYNVTFYPIRKDHGYVVLTGAGFENQSGIAALKPNLMGQEADDNWIVNVVDTSVWVDNPREKVIFYNISALNDNDYDPTFELDQVLIFNKATKIVEIFMNLRLVSINFPPCTIVVFNMSLTRMAIFDANPYCDRAFYGWKNITIADGKTQDAFIVLSYTNTTLEHWVRTTEGYDYFADYMLTYPIPDNFALGSCWWDSTDNDTLVDAYNVWNASQLRFARVAHPDPLTPPPWPNHVPDEFCMDKYVVLVMGDITGDGLGDGDQALTRVEWYTDVAGDPEEVVGATSGWKMVQYGVYDVNDTYDGGEGGLFDIGYLQLSTDIVDYARPLDYRIVGLSASPTVSLPPVWPAPWPHDPDTTLGWLDTFNNLYTGQVPTTPGFPETGVPCTLKEDTLTKWVFYLDIDQDGRKDLAEDDDGDLIAAEDEYFLPYSWYPTEELWWQLRWKLGPTTLEKIPNCTCSLFEHEIFGREIGPENDPGQFEWYEHECYDFTVVPAPGATTDAAGAAWLTARFTSWLVTFDVEAYNMIATATYANPGTKMLPYLMLRLASIPGGVQDYGARKARYLTSDGRALPQMEFESILVPNVNGTPWHNEHYLLVSVAGIHPNLATYYFNDFSPIIRPVGGDEVGSIVVLPYGGPYPFADLAADEGYGVISVARDHFNNTALLVWGGDSQDSYWTAWLATWYWETLRGPSVLGIQSWLIVIDYSTTGNNWGIPLGNGPDGEPTGIPTAHPWYPLINGQPVFVPVSVASEYWCAPPL